MVATRRACARVRRREQRRLHDRPRAQSGHGALHASPQAGRDALWPHAWRSRANPILWIAAQIDFAHRQGILLRPEPLRRFLHLYQSRARHVLVEDPHQLPARSIAFLAEAAGRSDCCRKADGETASAKAGPPPSDIAPRHSSLASKTRLALQPAPARAFVAEVEKLGMGYFGEDFQRLCDSRAGPVEILVTVGHEDSMRADRLQPVPLG